jgi:hypothetical protein
MKTLVNILVASAAAAGIMYLLRENEGVKGYLNKAKEKGSGLLDKAKGSLYDARGEAKSTLSDMA